MDPMVLGWGEKLSSEANDKMRGGISWSGGVL